ncbi:hypothetical protein RIF29_27857 [Crotalaria pallida]|uniref:Uncharacterized protein n=1 Tax=Crotalaria pallida TaxID=3830 RepID=A0AAN9EX94_CROPI
MVSTETNTKKETINSQDMIIQSQDREVAVGKEGVNAEGLNCNTNDTISNKYDIFPFGPWMLVKRPPRIKSKQVLTVNVSLPSTSEINRAFTQNEGLIDVHQLPKPPDLAANSKNNINQNASMEVDGLDTVTLVEGNPGSVN